MANEKQENTTTSVAHPASITDLRRNMKIEGTIRETGLYGAFVDIGLERDGLIHISNLSRRRIAKVSDVVSVGDRVTTWVLDVDPDQGRVGLSLFEPSDVTWRDIKEGKSYTGEVVRIEPYGVFVDIGAERPGLLHVSEIDHGFIEHPSEIFQKGEQVEVRILKVDHRKRRIDLTMLQDYSQPIFEEEEEEELPTKMELAFRNAQQEAARRRASSKSAKKRARSRDEQEEAFSRTLKRHVE